MATSNNDRVSSSGLLLFAKGLWTIIKGTFAKKDHTHAYDDITDKPVKYVKVTESDGSIVADMTFEQIATALGSGYAVAAIYGSIRLDFTCQYQSTSEQWWIVFESSFVYTKRTEHYRLSVSNGNLWVASSTNNEVKWDAVNNKPTTFTPAAHTHDGIVDNSDDERFCKAQYWGNGCSISSLSPTGTNKQSGSKYVAGFYNDGNGGVIAPCDAANVTVGTSTVAESVVMGTRISLSSTVTHDTLYSKSAPGQATEPAQVSAYRFNNGGSSPTSDGMVINIPWSSSYGRQLCLDDESGKMWTRYLNNGTWSSWSALSAPAGGIFQPVYINSDGVATACNFKIV